jgi:hypothetical protein
MLRLGNARAWKKENGLLASIHNPNHAPKQHVLIIKKTRGGEFITDKGGEVKQQETKQQQKQQTQQINTPTANSQQSRTATQQIT